MAEQKGSALNYVVLSTRIKDGVWPEDFMRSILVPLKKKPNATCCEDHRTISLISHASMQGGVTYTH